MHLRLSAVAAVSALCVVNAFASDGHTKWILKPSIPIVPLEHTGPVASRNGTVLPPYNTTYFFQQLIDHNNPSLGTFTQRYWHTSEFYEEGGPIILFTPGEDNASPYTGYLTNATINGLIAQQVNGAVVLLEHRFFGLSNPLPDLTVESLKLLTTQQAIDDFEYFSKNVVLPMTNGNKISSATTPWILTGGSYSGALTSWTMVNKPGLFAAGYASSAVVEAIVDFWEYFEPMRLHMPANCSADIQRVIAHVDEVFTGSDQTAIQAIKDNFGIGNVTHLDDVASALKTNFGAWQRLLMSAGPGAPFFQFCDALEVKNSVSAPAEGWGLDHALAAWGSYWITTFLAQICGDDDPEDCIGTYNASQPYYTDTSIDNADRSWQWMVCNEFSWFHESAPIGHLTMVSRLAKPSRDLRQCGYMFPGYTGTPNVARTNSAYRGWNISVPNLFFANGERDPWRYATVSAPGVTVKSTPSQPIAVGEGYHCGDLRTSFLLSYSAKGNITDEPPLNSFLKVFREGAANPSIAAVQAQALSSIKTWLAAWKSAEAKREVAMGGESGVWL
ncbi:Peptidase S28 [Mycena venus]|uniref:Peptidase S28 n=1 Tax=Mycena venus TaxID=2733690 RepID=A0A8H7D825_9AGAR|nr:Peptidase S28 [Mycena venus]